MSEAFIQLIDRAVKDGAFRELLLSAPMRATEGYALTDEERNILISLDEDQLTSFAGGLGDRTTKGSWNTGL